MERYLDGQELAPEEVASALKSAVTRGELFPVTCGVATKNLGTTAVLDLLVEGVPSPAKKGSPIEVEGAQDAAFVFKTVADPFAGRINVFRVLKGTDRLRRDARQRAHARQGAGRPLLTLQGKEHEPADEFGEGDLGAVAKLKDVHDRRPPARRRPRHRAAEPRLPRAGDELRDHAEGEGRRGEGRDLAAPAERGGPDAPSPPRPADRRAAPLGDDPDARRGRGRPAEAPLRGRGRPATRRASPISRRSARSRAATGATRSRRAAAASSATATSCSSRSKGHTGYEFVDKIVGGVIPQRLPARRSTRASRRRWLQGELAGAPVQGVRVRLVDGSYHTVDSSEMAFKIAGSMAFKQAYEQADPVLLEPIMEVDVTVPDDTVGAVNGDLNSRRGRLQGMEPTGGMTQIKAEVPMAEMLTYGQALTSMTGGRGDYHMQFLRYDEVPSHVAQKLIEETEEGARRGEGLSGLGGARCPPPLRDLGLRRLRLDPS